MGLGRQKELLPAGLSSHTSIRDWSYGNMGDPRNFLTWKGMCQVCGKINKNESRLICSNFLLEREN
jgi:hypothetical protein